jgi:hypothetical protein
MIKVLTDFLLKQILHKHETSGCLVKWAIELREFNLEYLPRPSLKGQELAYFIAEFISGTEEEKPREADLWIIDVDDSMNKRSNRAGVVVKPLEG